MKPVRSKAHLAFVRSLPCVVCLSERNVEAAHVGHRGMGQKSSDLETIPLCSRCHREQHRIGLKEFSKVKGLDIMAIVGMIGSKARIDINGLSIVGPGLAQFGPYKFEAWYRGHGISLGAVRQNLFVYEFQQPFGPMLRYLRDRAREILAEEIREMAKQRAA